MYASIVYFKNRSPEILSISSEFFNKIFFFNIEITYIFFNIEI